MAVEFDSGCQTPLRACQQSPLRVRGCGGGLLFNGSITYNVVPDDTDDEPYKLIISTLGGFVGKRIFMLILRNHDSEEPTSNIGRPAFVGDTIQNVEFYKDNLWWEGGVISYPFDVTQDDVAFPWADPLGFLNAKEGLFQMAENKKINVDAGGSGNSIAFCEIDDALFFNYGAHFLPSETEQPQTLAIGKVTGEGLDAVYGSVGDFTGDAGQAFFYGGAPLISFKDTVVTKMTLNGESVSKFYKYTGDSNWTPLNAGDPSGVVGDVISQQGVAVKMSFETLNGGRKLDYIVYGDRQLWVYSEEGGFQKALEAIGVPTATVAFTVWNEHEGQVIFECPTYKIVGQDEVITGALLWGGDEFDITAIGRGEGFTFVVNVQKMASAHGRLYGTGDRSGSKADYMPFYAYKKSRNLWEQLEFELPKIPDATVTLETHTSSKLWEMPKDFEPSNFEVGGTDWEVAEMELLDATIPLLP